MTLAVRPAETDGKQRIFLDSGHSFLLPDQKVQFESMIRRRVGDIELTALLKKQLSAGLGTAELWVDNRVAFRDVQPLAKTLVQSGFDTLRYAVDSSNQSRNGAH
jgi:hypothetical protein